MANNHCGFLTLPFKYLEIEIILTKPLIVTMLIAQSWITLVFLNQGWPSSMEYIGSTTLLFMIVIIIMYRIPWMWIHILGTIPKGLIDEKSIVLKLNGVGWCGGNLNFYLNLSMIALTPSSTTLLFTCISIVIIEWFTIIKMTMAIGLD